MPFTPDPAAPEATAVDPRLRAEVTPGYDPGVIVAPEPWYAKHAPAVLSTVGGIGGMMTGGPPAALAGAGIGGAAGEGFREAINTVQGNYNAPRNFGDILGRTTTQAAIGVGSELFGQHVLTPALSGLARAAFIGHGMSPEASQVLAREGIALEQGVPVMGSGGRLLREFRIGRRVLDTGPTMEAKVSGTTNLIGSGFGKLRNMFATTSRDVDNAFLQIHHNNPSGVIDLNAAVRDAVSSTMSKTRSAVPTQVQMELETLGQSILSDPANAAVSATGAGQGGGFWGQSQVGLLPATEGRRLFQAANIGSRYAQEAARRGENPASQEAQSLFYKELAANLRKQFVAAAGSDGPRLDALLKRQSQLMTAMHEMAPRAAATGEYMNAKYEGQGFQRTLAGMAKGAALGGGSEFALHRDNAPTRGALVGAALANPRYASYLALMLADPVLKGVFARYATQELARPAVEVVTGKPQ